MQSEEVDQVGHDVHTWEEDIEHKEAEKRPHATGIVHKQKTPFCWLKKDLIIHLPKSFKETCVVSLILH